MMFRPILLPSDYPMAGEPSLDAGGTMMMLRTPE
jgi:hypothetical protein